MYSMAEEKTNLTSNTQRNDWSLNLTLSHFNLTMFISEEFSRLSFVIACFPGVSTNEFAIKQTEIRVKALRGGGVLHD